MDGTHQGYQNAVQILELEYEEAIQRANLFRDYQLDCARHLFELEKHMSLQEYQVFRINQARFRRIARGDAGKVGGKETATKGRI